jgi:Do/DeqQ family serine protease
MKGLMEIRRGTAILALVAASIGGGLVASYVAHGSGTAPVFVSTAQAASGAEALPQTMTFAPVVKRAAPAVVQISSTKVIKAEAQGRNGRGDQQNPFSDDPFFRRFFGDQNPFQPRDRRESGLGSGVIVSPNGYILTNNHVVEGATSVKVMLSDHREFTAKIVGTDSQSDVAVVKIEAKNDLPVLPLSDSSKAQVGDICLAIGNPFGIGQTVTMGIVSATGRNSLGIESYEDFIQTDAAINPGNSGGALINARGELIGINTAILSGSGANAGVGFAIPINMARNVMDQLMKSGKVVRGYMGAMLQNVDPNVAKAFGLPSGTAGAAITSVDPGTPADKAGLKQGDVITALNNEPIADMAQLRLRIASFPPATTVHLHVFRDGKPQDVNVTLAERPSDKELARNRRGGGGGQGGDNGQPSSLNGVSVEDLSPQIAQQLGLDRNVTGVVVTDVDEASAAAEAGVQQGDVIQQVNRQAVRSTQDFDRLTRNANGTVLLLVNRGGRTLFIPIEGGGGKQQ